MGRVHWFAKWVLGPATAVALGYFAIAPMVRGKVPKIVERAASIVAPKIKPPPQATDAAPSPSVRVDVKPVAEDEAPKPTRRRRRRETPREEARPVETPLEPERTGPDPASTPGD